MDLTTAVPDWTEIILIVAMLVIVPLGLAAIARDRVGGLATPHLATLRRVQPVAGLIASSSFFIERGVVAGLVTLPWLAFTTALAALGAIRLLSRPMIRNNGIGIDAGLGFIVVGGGWLTLSRLGLNPMGFDDVIVRLTAVHFHYAGFALPIIAGAIAPRDRSNGWWLPAATIVGVPLTAIGITVGGGLEWVTATTMALIGMTVARRLFVVGRRQSDRVARRLLATAGAALSVGMALAITYAWFVRFGIDGLPIDRMARTHGSLNAFGFGLIGLIGLRRSDVFDVPADAPAGTSLSLRAIGVRPDDTWALIGPSQPAATAEKILAMRDGRTDRWERPIEFDRFETAVVAVQAWAGHDAAGIVRRPATPSIETDSEIAMSIPAVGPFDVTATCRIVDVVNEIDRFGFTYATLPHHVVEGVETFLVCRDDERAWVEVTAHWRPQALAARIAPPITRLLQKRAISRYLDGIATHETSATINVP